MTAKIRGGYYIKARCIINSEIMHSPPHIREVWDWLLMKANHADYKASGRIIERGQLFTSLEEIREALSWYIGYRKMSYTKDQMKASTKALKKASMITTTKTTRGMIVTICNYDFYQNPKNYESTHEATNESTNETLTNTPMCHHDIQELKELKIKNHDQDDSLNFNIEKYLDDKSRTAAKKAVPGKDIYYYIPIFNDFMQDKAKPDNPVGAFINWWKKYTKNEEF